MSYFCIKKITGIMESTVIAYMFILHLKIVINSKPATICVWHFYVMIIALLQHKRGVQMFLFFLNSVANCSVVIIMA